MTTQSPPSPPSSPPPDTTTPQEFACQNGDGNPWAVALIRPGISETDFLCESCNLAMWLAVLQQMAEAGTITLG